MHEIQIVHDNIECVIIPKNKHNEYERLKTENNELTNKIIQLEHNADIFRQTI